MRLREVASGSVREVVATQVPPGVVAVRVGRTVWVREAGRTFRFEKAERAAARPDDEGRDLFAPMPGRVVKVLVSEGDLVEAGTPLFLLEAMKMEHEVRSPRRGKVKRLFRREGEMVAATDPLAEVE